MEEYDSSHPEVIRAKGEAQEKILNARAKLSPAAQTVYAVFDSLTNLISELGCLVIIILIVIGFFSNK